MAEVEDEKCAQSKMNVQKFSQDTLRIVLAAVGNSNQLLKSSEDFDFYGSFKGFRKMMNAESKEMTKLMSQILSHQEIKCRLDDLDLEEMFDALVEANDLILEKVAASIDEASNVKKVQTPVLTTAAAYRAEISTSWNRKRSRTTSQPYRLITAHNILRPQLKFMAKIDNSEDIFVPIIKEKPNSLKPLSIVLEQTEYGEMFSHPYHCELSHFNPDENHLQIPKLQFVKPYEETEFVFVNKVEQLAPLISDLQEQSEFAIDLEHHSYRTFQGITCLMQISTRQRDYIVDTLELWNDLQPLNEAFTNPKIVKVFHGADNDIEWLQRDLGIYVVNMFDTGQASRVLNFNSFSLSHLLKTYCGVDAEKQFQLADWRIRPLPEELINYARGDTHYLLYIYDKMKNELISQGNQGNNLLLSVFQRSRIICEKRYVKPVFRPDGYLDVCRKYGKIFNNRQKWALKELYSWRNKVARMEDESLGYVLPNHMLMQIAEVLPREMQGILACCNPIPALVRQYLNELHQIILKARDQSLIAPVVEDLQIQVDESRREVDLDNNLLCPHDYSHLKESGVVDTGPSVLDLWNKFGDDLEKELRTINTKVPQKVAADLSALVHSEEEPKCEIQQTVKNVQSSLSEFTSYYKRYKLLREKRNIEMDDSVEDSKDDLNNKPHVKNVEDHFMKLVDSFKKEPTSSSESTSKQKSKPKSEENNETMPSENNEAMPSENNEAMPSENNETMPSENNTPIRKSIKKARKRKNKIKEDKNVATEDKTLPVIKKRKVIVDKDNFKPFDYNQKIAQQLKLNKKNKIHDPTASNISYKTGKASKTRLKGKGKSCTFASRKNDFKHNKKSQ